MTDSIFFRNRPHPRRVGKALRWATLAIFSAAAALSISGCMRGRPAAVMPLKSTILIMDLAIPDDIAETGHSVGGWWFGAHTDFQNANVGTIFADVLTLEMRRQMDWADLFDRLYVRQYFSRKRGLLQNEFTDSNSDELDELMARISPLEFARELGADKVIVGKINSSATFYQRTFKYWSSSVDVRLEMLDVDSGRSLWRGSERKKGRLRSQKTVMELIAQSLMKDLSEDYFFNPQENSE